MVVGIDPAERFQDAGVRLGRRSASLPNLHFALADGMALPFPRSASFDLVLSHAVIEHVADAPLYLRECARVLGTGRTCVSVDRAVPLVCGSSSAAAEGAGAAASHRRPPGRLRDVSDTRAIRAVDAAEPANENSFIKAARRGEVKHDDLLEKVRVHAASRADRRVRAAHRSRGAARDRHGAADAGRRGPLAPRQPAHAGRADQQHGVRAERALTTATDDAD